MSVKVGAAQLEVLINFMENHQELAKGKFNGPSGRDIHKKLWAQLANNLNSLGYGEKSIEKWQKVSRIYTNYNS